MDMPGTSWPSAAVHLFVHRHYSSLVSPIRCQHRQRTSNDPLIYIHWKSHVSTVVILKCPYKIFTQWMRATEITQHHPNLGNQVTWKEAKQSFGWPSADFGWDFFHAIHFMKVPTEKNPSSRAMSADSVAKTALHIKRSGRPPLCFCWTLKESTSCFLKRFEMFWVKSVRKKKRTCKRVCLKCCEVKTNNLQCVSESYVPENRALEVTG